MQLIRRKRPDAKILIVDDMPENIELLETILSSAGYRNFQSTSDSREAFPIYRSGGFDLVVLDLRMPHLDGFQVMEQLASANTDDYLPILVLTGQLDRETRNRALAAGAKDFITKPFDRTEVVNRIDNILEVRALYNERGNQAKLLEKIVKERTSELMDRNRELENTRLDIIRRLGRAAEYRDNETGMHVIRMSESCRRLALAIGLDDEFAQRILQASPMHDVGKIGIPDQILLKPGKLDPAEWEIMKTHAEIGADILGDYKSDLMQMARIIALTHHEKWDGTGYPNGLSGDAIPLEGRISAICDVFDALTSVRPYKKAWTIAEANAYIDENSGRHFDPEMVRAFNAVLPDILKIRDQYSDTEIAGTPQFILQAATN